MIKIIDHLDDLPKQERYRIAHSQPPDDVEAYELTDWLTAIPTWFVVVDKNELTPGECYMCDKSYRA
jgi:hypothetical protein